jgi:EAL domain
VLNLARSEGDAVIVRSTIELGHNLGLSLVAEGVEDEVALGMLQAWGCDLIQGYLISWPLAEVDVVPWLDDRASFTLSPAALSATATMAGAGTLVRQGDVGPALPPGSVPLSLPVQARADVIGQHPDATAGRIGPR